MSNTELKLEISEGQIRNAIAVAMAEAFTDEKRDALLRDIIRAHLQYKENSYDKETLLGKTIGKLVREIAKDELENIITRMKPQIREITKQTLGSRFENSVLDQLKIALSGKIIGSIHLTAYLDDET